MSDVWFRWARTDRTASTVRQAWLTTVTTRVAVDHLRARRRQAPDYPGPWLPEPIVGAPGPEEVAELADSLTLGFLILLDELGPVERAVFVLADVFAVPYDEIAEVVAKSPAACRQIASRARRRVQAADLPRASGPDRRLVDELLVRGRRRRRPRRARPARSRRGVHLATGARPPGGPPAGGDRAPGGPPAHQPVRAVRGSDRGHAGQRQRRRRLRVEVDGAIDQVLSCSVADGMVTAIRITRNPDKLRLVGSHNELR